MKGDRRFVHRVSIMSFVGQDIRKIPGGRKGKKFIFRLNDLHRVDRVRLISFNTRGMK